jgi:cytochrome c peroxidase
MSQTFSTTGDGRIDLNNTFFRSLGTNGRSCASCHLPDQGWTVAAKSVALRFTLTNGLDPIFRTVDGSICDHGIDTSSVSGRKHAVAGLNDATGLPLIPGNCGTCHSSPNAGDHSVSAPLNIGVADLSNSLGVSYLPVVTLRNKTTGAIAQTSDPGRALITGKRADMGKLKGPVLRALASRAPYFHNGSAQTLSDVIDFYNTRFAIGFTAQEKADLVAFLNAL